MSLKSKRILILPVVLAISFFSFAFVQTSTNQEAKTISKVEISIPLQKEDFLLFMELLMMKKQTVRLLN